MILIVHRYTMSGSLGRIYTSNPGSTLKSHNLHENPRIHLWNQNTNGIPGFTLEAQDSHRNSRIHMEISGSMLKSYNPRIHNVIKESCRQKLLEINKIECLNFLRSSSKDSMRDSSKTHSVTSPNTHKNASDIESEVSWLTSRVIFSGIYFEIVPK